MRISPRAVPRLALTTLLAATVACQPAPERADETADTAEMTGASAADVRTAIDGVRSDWIAGAEASDAAAVAQLYAEDAVYLTPDGQRLSGRQAIQEYLTQALPMMSDLEITSLRDPVVGSDLAVDMGEYSATMTAPGGEAMASGGSYMVVLREQADGAWRIVSHMASQQAETPGG